jgi:hypothetical protein
MFLHLKSIAFALPLLLLSLGLHGQSVLNGGIYANTTLTLANSPYVMTGNVVVFPNVTLTIEPGVTIFVEEVGPSGPLIYLEVRGTLTAVGTPALPIRFQARDDSTTNSTWLGINVKNSQGGNASISHIVINNSSYPISHEQYFTATSVIENSHFNYSGSYPILGPTTFRDCSFNNGTYGIYGAFTGDSLIIERCRFTNNVVGVFALGCIYKVSNSFFLNSSGYALVAGAQFSEVTKSSFVGNTIGITQTQNLLIDSCTFNMNVDGILDAQSAIITNSIFDGNTRGLEVGRSTFTSRNEISGNDVGIRISANLNAADEQPVIVNNVICGNTLYNVENGSDLNYVLDSNCFCLPDSAAIDAKLFDGYDDITRGLVNFSVYDSTCTNILSTVSKVIGAPTATPEITLAALAIFPNPSTGFVEVRLQTASGTVQGQVIDLQGRTLQNFRLLNGRQLLDLSSLPKGMYQISLQAGDGTRRTKRVVLE